MRSASRLASLAVTLALWGVLGVYAGRITHDFYTHADRAVYAAVDDGEANIAYSLASHGTYAFPASPVLVGLTRMHGQFNYGPWYFYLAGALVWLFGYSLTLVRSIHLWVVLVSVAAAIVWFRGHRGAAASGLFGVTFLHFFATVQWPMARPDSLVTLFAVIAIVATGLGMSRRRPIWWFVAGVAAACGAFTHLIAASLAASVVLLLLAHVWLERGTAPSGAARRAAIALGCGLLAGAVMFYASFGFGVSTQWRFLMSYRGLTATGESYTVAIARHLRMAFGDSPPIVQRLVWVVLGAAWLMVLGVLRAGRETARMVWAFVLPPLAIWTLYLLSNGKYTNYHSGYAILHQAMLPWTAAAMLVAACEWLGVRRPVAARVAATLAAMAVLAFSVRQVRLDAAAPVRAADALHRVGFSEYVDHVIGSMPGRSVVWGSAFFGIESPDRVQLVQQDDAVTLARQLGAAGRAAFAPDFLAWGFPELRDDVDMGLAGRGESHLSETSALLGARFRLVSLVGGAPYGVTRVYARVDSDGHAQAPSVAVYDEVHRRWLERAGDPLPAMFRSIPPVPLQIGYVQEPPARVPTATVTAELPPGHYLIHIVVRPAPGRARRLISVTSATMRRQTIVELGVAPEGDFAAYVDGERDVFALAAHPGGVLHVSQFDGNAGAAIESVTASPLLDLVAPGEQRARAVPLPSYEKWSPMAGIQMLLKDGRTHVYGDASVAGYQMYSPLIEGAPGARVDVDVPSVVAAGSVCAGIINARGLWLVPATGWRQQFDVTVDRTGGFRVVFTNCQWRGEPQPSRFDLLPSTYTTWSPLTYADRLVGAALEGGPAAWRPAAPAPVRFPEQPRLLIADRRATGPLLVQSPPQYIDAETRLLVAGRLAKGTVSIGFLNGGTWVDRMNVTEPGEFVAILAPRSAGTYTTAVATGPANTPETTVTLTRVDLLPAIRPAK